jgi:hypothetical protein
MQASGFDFTKVCDIDFNIDLQDWPPPDALVAEIESRYGAVTRHPPGLESGGYLSIVEQSILTYRLVMQTQAELTALASPHAGICQSWGVLQVP